MAEDSCPNTTHAQGGTQKNVKAGLESNAVAGTKLARRERLSFRQRLLIENMVPGAGLEPA